MLKQSSPRRKRIRLPLQEYLDPQAWYFVTICCRHKQSRFRAFSAPDLVVESLRRTAGALKVEIAAYTVLPDHVHLIASGGAKGLVAFVQAFKSKTALEMTRRGEATSPWQRGFFDHKLRSNESLREKCEYVWLNPVRRGLVRRPEDYKWSGTVLTD